MGDDELDPTLEDLSVAALALRAHDRYRAKVIAGEGLLRRQHRRRRRLGALWPWLLGLSVVMLAGVAAYLAVVIARHHSTTVADYQALYGDDVQLRAEVGTLQAQLRGLGAKPAAPPVAAAPPAQFTTPPSLVPARVGPAPRPAGSPASSTTSTTSRHSPPPPPPPSTTTTAPCSVSAPSVCIRTPGP